MAPLHRDAVGPELLELLRQLMHEPVLAPFALVGGTALALCLGHRRSIDIDLFTPEPFDTGPVADTLGSRYDLHDVAVSPNSMRGVICGIKVDLIAHQYRLVEPIQTLGGVRLFSMPDLEVTRHDSMAAGHRDCQSYQPECLGRTNDRFRR